jgi:hypothetical protein
MKLLKLLSAVLLMAASVGWANNGDVSAGAGSLPDRLQIYPESSEMLLAQVRDAGLQPHLVIARELRERGVLSAGDRPAEPRAVLPSAASIVLGLLCIGIVALAVANSRKRWRPRAVVAYNRDSADRAVSSDGS